MTIQLPKIMIVCLICTITIEAIIAFIIGIRSKKDIINVILVNILTNPIVSVIPFVIGLKYGLIHRSIILVILEILALISEGMVYNKFFKYNKMNGYKISLILNISSYFIGTIINQIIW